MKGGIVLASLGSYLYLASCSFVYLFVLPRVFSFV